MKTREPVVEQVNKLFDYAVMHPQGFTYLDVQRDLSWDRQQLYAVGQELRRLFASSEINLVATPPGVQSEPWVYKLTGNQADALPWQQNRLGDAETRLETIENVAASVANGTSARTLVGRKARLMQESLRYLRQQLAHLQETAV